MSNEADGPKAHYDRHRAAMAPILRLDHLPAEWNVSITGFLVMAAAAADLYLDFPLDDAFDEAAPVFTPQPADGMGDASLDGPA